MSILNHAVNFALVASIGFLVLMILNLCFLLARLMWFNTPDELAQKGISDSLSWCTYWGSWLVLSIVTFVILYVIQVN